MISRILAVLAAALGLLLLSPLFLIVALLIKLTSRGPVFFSQVRVGRGFRPFGILKFRTMVTGPAAQALQITPSNDPRVTGVGKWLRRLKIDELPQLVNILKGEMSFVGPRPEVPGYVEKFREDYKELLKVRPGLTDLASLKYRDEGRLLKESPDPDKAYVEVILPDKIRLAKIYLARSSAGLDLAILVHTLVGVGCPRRLDREGASPADASETKPPVAG
jgi:lipopolysaccharide/colanic/teichoic acid biosynthesis glycosyltransferase